MPPRLKQEPPDSASSEESDVGEDDKRQGPNYLSTTEDPRTLSQIKRSRIDLARRYVFLCPLALSKHFEALPHQAKDAALLVFRCQRNWLFPDRSTVRRSRTSARVECGLEVVKKAHGAPVGLGNSHYRGEFAKEFLQWVLTKEKEGCVYWYKPDKDLRKLSLFLEEKIDPVNERPYRPLLLDPQWWRVRFVRTGAKYVHNPSLVVASIAGDGESGKDLDIPVMQELIYQSNPTLEPISKWPHAPSMRFVPRPQAASKDFAGRDTKYKGYIDQDKAMDGSALPACAKENTRLSRWPEIPKGRLDNLHHLWRVEESSFARHQTFASYGRSAMGGALTAR